MRGSLRLQCASTHKSIHCPGLVGDPAQGAVGERPRLVAQKRQPGLVALVHPWKDQEGSELER